MAGEHVDDVELAAFVDGELAAADHERVAGHLDGCDACRAVVAAAVRADTRPEPREIGSALGRYQLGRLLGAGQMGEIYVAHDPMLGRDIAIKVIRPRGADPERAAERLLVEARAMAKLRHPNVVRVYDAGIDRGQVFLTMERVGAGITLRGWLEDAPRRAREILAAFRVIADALAAAHTAGVIHGDVKPDNVLVDEDGRMLVADFGLARAGAEPVPQDRALAATVPALGTAGGPIGGTPVYMAPELFDGQRPSARSDQFSFCVALEEALTGRRPFEGESLSSLAAAIQRGERRPRKAVGGVPRRVWAAIDRGLARDPAQRFASLAAVATELAPRRTTWLVVTGAPVLALGAAVAALTLRGGTSPCGDAATALAAVWSPARASEVHDPRLAGDLDRRASAWAAARVATCKATREQGTQSDALLDARMGCLDEQLSGLAAAVAGAAAGSAPREREHVYDVLRALPAPEACADLGAARAKIAAPPAEHAAEIAELRRGLARAAADNAAGRHEAARGAAREVVTRARTLGYPPVLAEALIQLGRVLHDDPTAEPALREAAQVAAAAHYDVAEAEAWTQLVYLAGYVGNRHAEARAWDEAARAAVARAGAQPGQRAALACNEAALAISANDYKTGLARADECVAIDRERLASPGALAISITARAAALRRLGKLDDARAAYGEVLELLRRDPEANADVIAGMESNLGGLLGQLGKLDEAQRMLTHALEAEEALLDPGDAGIGETLDHLGALARKQRDLDGAERWWRRELDEMRTGDRRRFADALANLAVIHLDRGKLADARDELAQVVKVRTEILGQADPDVAEARMNLALVDLQSGHAKQAAAGFEGARDAFAAALGDDTAQVATAWVNLGEARSELADEAGALAAYQEGIARFDKLPHHEAELGYALARAAANVLPKDPARARQLAERAIEVDARANGFDLGNARFVRAQALWAQGERPGALTEAAAALAAFDHAKDAAGAAMVKTWLGHKG